MNELKLLLRILITPSLWICRGTYSKTWDKLVREQIKEAAPINFDDGEFGNLVIDLDSYDFGRSSRQDFICYGWRCSRRTLLLLKDYVEKATEEEYRKRFNKLTKALK